MTRDELSPPGRAEEPVRILVCEDDPRTARLLAKMLSRVPGFETLGPVSTGEEACRIARAEPIDLLLLDLELPRMSGVEVIEALSGAVPGLDILVLTTFADENRVFEAVRAGAAGYLVKGLAAEKLEAAIREVLAGGSVIAPELGRRFWNLFAAVRGKDGSSYGLTEEELALLTLVGRGLSNPEAARSLGSSRRAVKGFLERIYRKLGVSNRVEATVRALRAGLIDL
jgi:DNA-binding NarL/FixJ family response regulator